MDAQHVIEGLQLDLWDVVSRCAECEDIIRIIFTQAQQNLGSVVYVSPTLMVRMEAAVGATANASLLLSAADRAFERFWNSYPRRIAKVAARKAFDKMKCQLVIKQILASLEQHKTLPNWKHGMEYIPHPASWLNQQRWNDETTGAKANGHVSKLAGTDAMVL